MRIGAGRRLGQRGRVTIARHGNDPRSAFSRARKEGPAIAREKERQHHQNERKAAASKRAIARQTIVSKARAAGMSDRQIAALLGEADD